MGLREMEIAAALNRVGCAAACAHQTGARHRGILLLLRLTCKARAAVVVQELRHHDADYYWNQHKSQTGTLPSLGRGTAYFRSQALLPKPSVRWCSSTS